jgi:hypothetical protein
MFLAIANSVSSLIKPYISKITSALAARSDYYENIKGTNNILFNFGAKLLDKASIVLTPTAYSDGSLNTVIPPYQVLPTELVTNGDFSDGTNGWTVNASALGYISTSSETLQYLSGHGDYAEVKQLNNSVVGKKYKGQFEVISKGTNATVYIQYGRTNIYSGNISDLDLGVHTFEVVSSHSDGFSISVRTNGIIEIDNVSVKEVQEADFDFSRGSSATRVNEKGLIEDVQILSGELVQNGDFEQIGSELVTNGNFDTDSDWTLGTGWSISDGKLVGDGAESNALQSGVVQNGKTYKITLTANNITTGYISVRIGSGGSENFQVNSNGTQTFYTTADNGTFVLFRNQSGFDGSIDNVSVKEVGQNWSFGTGWSIEDGKAYYDGVENFKSLGQNNVIELNKKYRLNLDVSGLTSDIVVDVLSGNDFANPRYLTLSNGNVSFEFTATNALNNRFAIQAAQGDEVYLDNISVVEITDDTDIPRIDYTSGTGALLLEPSRTNYVVYSETEGIIYGSNGWASTPSNIVVTQNYGTTPFSGTELKSTRVQYTGSGQRLENEFTAVTIQAAATMYVKGTSGETIKFGTSSNESIFTLTGDWQKIEQIDSTSRSSSKLTINTYSGATARDIEIYAPQVEQGSYPTSYIPTNGSAVTRSADVANNSGNADLFNDSEGVLYAEISALANYNTQRWLSISDNTHANTVKLGLLNNATNFRFAADIRSGNTNQAFMTYDFGAITPTMTKVAVKYKENDFALWINGVEVATDTSGNTPIGLSSIQFDRGNGVQDFEGNVKSVAVFKEALTDAELESLTSWASFTEMATDLEYTLE